MKHCTRCNVRKHKEIKNGSKYINLYISLKFGSMDKIKIKYSEHKRMFGKSEKGLITSLGLKTNVDSKKKKKARCAINYISIKNLSKIIRDFESLPRTGYVRKRPKHEPTDSYFYPSRNLAKIMTRDDAFNSHVDPVRTEMTGTQQIMILHVCDSDESESKEILTDENLSQVCSEDKSESEIVTVNESLWTKSSQKVFTKVSTKIMENMQLMKQSTRNLWLQII